jgi:hypothetical protein
MASRRLIKSNSGVRGACFGGRDLQPITRPGEEFAFGMKSRVFQWVYGTDHGSRPSKKSDNFSVEQLANLDALRSPARGKA